MKKFAILVCFVVLSGQLVAVAANREKPVIKVSASVTTGAGAPREFHGPAGSVAWSPCLPLYPGDILSLSYDVTGPKPSTVSVSVDGKPIAKLTQAPWKVTVSLAGLSMGRHLAKADLRFPGTPIMYSISEFPFYVQAPPSAVKGIVESLDGEVSTSTAPPESHIAAMFTPPAESRLDNTFGISLCSLDPAADALLKQGQPVHVSKPTAFLIGDSSRLDRWAYVVTRDGRQIAAAGPMRTSVYLMVAPQTPGQTGFLPGEISLKVWGVTSNGRYSRPVEATLVIGQKLME